MFLFLKKKKKERKWNIPSYLKHDPDVLYCLKCIKSSALQCHLLNQAYKIWKKEKAFVVHYTRCAHTRISNQCREKEEHKKNIRMKNNALEWTNQENKTQELKRHQKKIQSLQNIQIIKTHFSVQYLQKETENRRSVSKVNNQVVILYQICLFFGGGGGIWLNCNTTLISWNTTLPFQWLFFRFLFYLQKYMHMYISIYIYLFIRVVSNPG